MRRILEQNASPRLHPGAEPEAPNHPNDTATFHVDRRKGIVATITPHFAVAVIVGLVTAFVARKPDHVTEETGSEARRCNESVTQLRADFTQFKAETSLHNQIVESRIIELLSRSIRTTSQDFEPSQLAPGVSRALRGQ